MVGVPAWVVAGVLGVVLAGIPGTADGRSEPASGDADLSVRVAVEPGVAQPGHPIVYRVQVHNAGPGDAVLPTMTLAIPAGVEIVGLDVGTCRTGTSVNEIVCPSPVDVPAGASGQLTVSGIVRPSATGPLRTVARIRSEVDDANEADNLTTVNTAVDEGADLGLRLRGRVRAGVASVSAFVRNRGPRLVRDARVYLRTGRARLVSSAGGRCTGGAGSVSCALAPMAAGERVQLRLGLRAPGRTVQATVFSARYGDRHPTDNQAGTRLTRHPTDNQAGTRLTAGGAG
ncbi:hypothetical protein ACIBHX_09080 [Nonomuraea sp. NPDC050536]|uniref:hypothetical protein n=1 Tax=Nonomuraea sp. NPDC050536 TaxID=3364366 RepID=UPI0037C5616E